MIMFWSAENKFACLNSLTVAVKGKVLCRKLGSVTECVKSPVTEEPWKMIWMFSQKHSSRFKLCTVAEGS